MPDLNTRNFTKFCMVALVASMFMAVGAAEKTVLFYEGNTDSDVSGSTEKEYTTGNKLSNLSKTLESGNFTVNRVTSYIGPDILNEYEPDVIALPNPRGIGPKQVGELLRWTARDGGSLWICANPEDGGGSNGPSSVSRVNMIAKGLGLTVSDSLLEDEQNRFLETSTEEEEEPTYGTGPSLSTNQNFEVFRSKSGVRSSSIVDGITMGVDSVTFHGASGIITPDDSDKVWTAITGEESTYTPNAPVFLKGSYPSLVVATELGQGRAIMTSDCDIYADENIGNADNNRLATNSFKWLSPNKTFQSMNYTEAIMKSETLNRKKIQLESEVESLESEVSELEEENNELRSEAQTQETNQENSGIPLGWISAFIFFITLIALVVALRDELKNRILRGKLKETVEQYNNQSSDQDSGGDGNIAANAEELGEDLDVN